MELSGSGVPLTGDQFYTLVYVDKRAVAVEVREVVKRWVGKSGVRKGVTEDYQNARAGFLNRLTQVFALV